MFAPGGNQYKVAAGDILWVEKLPGIEEGKVSFDKVLMVNDGETTCIGEPYIDAATVEANVISVGKGKKVIVFKFKAKKGYRRKQGHRQPFTEIEIESVTIDGKTIFKMEAPPEPEEPVEAETKDDAEEIAAAEDTAAAKDDADEDAAAAEDAAGESADDEADAPAEPEEAAAEDDKPEADDAAADDTESADAPQDDDAAAENKSTAAPSKMKKADIMARLDELGASYAKSARKDELLAILEEAEKQL
jgi:large subunit ribosomal protein L21